MAKKTMKAHIENVLSREVLKDKLEAAQKAFDVLATELTQKEREFNEYKTVCQQELQKLQGEYRVIKSLLS